MTPIDMLETELKLLQKCKKKSVKSYNNGGITLELHTIHLNNLRTNLAIMTCCSSASVAI